jgi:TRAP-type C4-dicarboxylate transport system permease small subunit
MSDSEKKSKLFFDTLLSRIINGMIVIGTMVIVVATFLQVLFRYFFNYSLAWTDETSRYTFVWITFIGAAVALKENKHVAVTYFESKLLSVKFRFFLHLIRQVVIAIFLGLTIKYGIDLVIKVYPDISPSMEITMALPYLGVPVGSCIILYYVLRDLLLTLGTIVKGDFNITVLDKFEGGDL